MCPYQQYKYGPCKQKQMNTKSNGVVRQFIFYKRAICHQIIHNPLTKNHRSYQETLLAASPASPTKAFSHINCLPSH